MNIKQAKNEIKNTVKAYLKKDQYGEYVIPENRQRPVLLIGPPGIGKTQIMQQIAAECEIGLVSYTITHHTRQSAVGLPFIKEASYEGESFSVTEYTMSEIISSIYRYMEETGRKEGILFIDEINCVSETLAPTMLQFLQCKTFGNQPVPKGWIIAAAGNPPEYNKSVREFDFVTLDRVRKMDLEADFSVFKEYARNQGIHPFILSYLELRPQNFYKTENDVDGLSFVTARGWEDLSYLIYAYESLEIPVDEDVILEFLQHEDIAKDVAAYYDLYQKYKDDYDINNILIGKVKTEVYQKLFRASFDERLSCVTLLVDGLLQRISAAVEEDVLTVDCYEFLKKYKSGLETKEETPYQLYQTMLRKEQQKLKDEEKTGLLSVKQKNRKNAMHSLLERWTLAVGGDDSDHAFEKLKEEFDKQCEKREQQIKIASDSLEYAFDFMEDTFKEGQEMVIFVTELTLNPQSNRFITENGCERYFRYNKSLLIGNRRQQILNELEKDSIRSEASSYAF